MKKILMVFLASCLVFTPIAYAASTFKDVKPNAWYYSYVMKASEMGIIDGYKDKTFRPNDKVTRGQLAKILVDYDKTVKARTEDEDKVINAISKSVPSVVKVITSDSIGSGFFVRQNILLTNAHVVGNSKTVNITFLTGQTIKGTVTNKDPAKDIAIVQVNGKYNYLSFASSVTVGQTAIAIGNPLDMDFTVTKGMVSKLNITDFKASKMFQFDAAINSGNSGGALINSQGQVIGMVTGKLVNDFKEVEGMAYAIHFSELDRYLKLYGK